MNPSPQFWQPNMAAVWSCIRASRGYKQGRVLHFHPEAWQTGRRCLERKRGIPQVPAGLVAVASRLCCARSPHNKHWRPQGICPGYATQLGREASL